MKAFKEELVNLRVEFMKMAALVNESIANSRTAFVNHDAELASQVIANDSQMNELQIFIEKKSFELIALYQPVTSDLREIISILKAVTDLERAGDHARNISRSTIKIDGQKRIGRVEEVLATMSSEVKKQFSQSIQAYSKSDQNLAVETTKIFSTEINDLYNAVAAPSYQSMSMSMDTVNSAIIYLNVARDLSRISDYSVNICEWTVYLVTGKIVELN